MLLGAMETTKGAHYLNPLLVENLSTIILNIYTNVQNIHWYHIAHFMTGSYINKGAFIRQNTLYRIFCLYLSTQQEGPMAHGYKVYYICMFPPNRKVLWHMDIKFITYVCFHPTGRSYGTLRQHHSSRPGPGEGADAMSQ